MNKQLRIVVQSRWLCGVLIAGSLLYAYVFIQLAGDLPRGMFRFALYALFGIPLGYATWVSGYVVVIDNEKFEVTKLLGLGARSTFMMKDVHRILVRPNNSGRVVLVVLEFADKRRVQLHQFQVNFDTARAYVADHLDHVSCEVLSKWAL